MSSERDSKTGQFKKGHRGLGGRKPRSREELYREAFRTAVSVQQWIKIIKKAANDAVHPTQHAARHQARTFLANYLIGPPVQKIAPTDPSGENEYAAMSDAQLLALVHHIAATDSKKKKQGRAASHGSCSTSEDA